LELTHGPAGPGVLADGRALPIPPHSSATEVGLAAARRHAARSGRDLRVEVVDGAAVTLVAVSPHGAVTLLEAPATAPLPRVVVTPEPATALDRTTVHVAPPASSWPTTPPVAAWVSPAPPRPRRPVSSLVVAGLVAVAVLVGAVGTGVATLSSAQALPDSCRPVTVYAVDGQGGSSDVLKGVTDPLARQFGEKVSVVTVPAPPTGGSFASAESEAVGSLATAVGEHVDGCPTGSLMLFGYSQGAQVAGDLASRVGTGLEPRIPAKLVQAVGLFGDPARSPRTRAVPDGTTGQGALPPRAVGFGSLDARTIEVCAPGDPVCDSPANAASPSLEQALASPVHGSYQQLPVAAGTTAPQWAASSLGKVVAAIPTTSGPASAGTAPQSGPVSTTPGAGSRSGSDTSTGGAAAVTTTPEATGGSSGSGEGSYDQGTTGGGSATTGASGSSGSVTSGQGSGGTSSTGSGDTGTSGSSTVEPSPTGSAPSAGTGDRGYGTGTGGGGSGSGSSAPASTRASSGSGAEEPTTTTSSRERGKEKTGQKGSGTTTSTTTAKGGTTSSATGAAWSLVEGLEGFKSTPWNNQNATDPSAAASPNVPGREAVKFEMPGGGKRTEAEPDVPEFREGQKAFIGYSGFFDKGFPTNTDTWQVIMQFKQPGTGSPPLSVEVGKGQLRLANNGRNQKDFCPVTDGGAFSFQLGVTFGGAVDAWCNGQQTLSAFRTPEPNVQGSAYLKTGIYRDESIKQDSTLFVNDLKVGKTLDSVSVLAGAANGSGTTASASAVADTGTGTGTTAQPASASTGTGTTAQPAAATAGSRATAGGTQKLCDKFGSTDVDGGRFAVQNNEWGASGQCVTAQRQGFTVESGDHTKSDTPAAYPSIVSGCWMGTCTRGTPLPARIGDLGPITSSIAGTIPQGTTSNLA
jgi:hypothetical protein